MNELDEVWSQMLEKAIANAKASDRGDVAEYLELKQTNDLIRQTSVDWLFDVFIGEAAQANRNNASVTIEREEPHEFRLGNATMSGSLVRVRLGIRNLTVEAGWTRLPSHGVMRNGSLAAARIKHFGIPKADDELSLMTVEGNPVWKTSAGEVFDSERVGKHINILLQIDRSG